MSSTENQDFSLATVTTSETSFSSPHPPSTEQQPDQEQSPEHSRSRSNLSVSTLRRFLKKRLPILRWLPVYKKSDLVPDAISGVTVGLTAIPQTMAYAGIAGLTPEFGLYSSFVSCFVYLFLGSCRQMTIGPTAVMELLVFEICGQDFASCVVLTGFYVGVIQLLMGLLKLGAIVSLISDPVTVGFVGGAALTIGSSQNKSFLGFSGPKGNGFLGYWKAAIRNISTARLGDSLLGILCVVVLLILKNLKDYVKPSGSSRRAKFIGRLVWLLSIGRNAIVVISASVLAASMENPPFALTGNVKSGFPPVQPPQFCLPTFSHHHNVNHTTFGTEEVIASRNGTREFSSSAFNDNTLTFLESLSLLRTGPLTIAVISILQNVAIAKAFGSGQSIDATQEMIALGVSHICSSFFQSLPMAGSFSRSAVNESSGVRSPIGGIFTGLLVLFALSFLTSSFAFIPKASLAAVILCAVLPMIEYEAILPMWRVSKLDVLTAFVTFLASLSLGMEYGIIIGVVTSLGIYLARPVQPRVAWSIVNLDQNDKDHSTHNIAIVSTSENGKSPTALTPMLKIYHVVKPEQGFSFPSVDAIRTMINKLAVRHPEIKIIALDCESMITMDYTSASALSSLVGALKKNGKSLVFIHCQHEWVQMMKSVGLEKPEHFESVEDMEKCMFK